MDKRSEFKDSKILIVDDSPEDRDIYKQFLLRDISHRYVVLEADTGAEAFETLQEHPCSLILLDFNLPDVDGLEFLEILHQEQFQVPVVMMTGVGNEAIAVQSMKQGALDYLVKGQITPESLQSTVRNVLEQVRLQIQLRQSRERQELIISTALRIRQSLNLKEVLDKTTSEIHQLLACDRVLIYQFAEDMSGMIVAESVSSAYQVSLGQQIIDTCFQGGAGYGYSLGRCSVVDDIQQAGLTTCHRELLEEFQVKANLVVPILSVPTSTDVSSTEKESSQLWGLLIAHQCDQPRHWKTDEVELINSLSAQVAIAIQRAEMHTQTRRALQQEKELNVLKSQIIGTVSHEYRSPLTSILAAASTLKTHASNLTSSNQSKLLEIIEKKVRHMNGLIEDMLFLNQIDRGKVPVQSIPIDLLRFLQEKIEDYAVKQPEHIINLKIKGMLEPFENDPKILNQIFDNVLSNAIKYSRQTKHIDIEVKGLQFQVIAIIRDYGLGMKSEDLDRIFEPFHRGENVDTIPGTGLGLSIVQGCLNMCGGKISYSSEPNQGTKVTIGFPRKINCQLSSAEDCM